MSDGRSKSLFASSYGYALRKAVGVDRWDAWVRHELEHLDESMIRGLRTLGHAASLGEPIQMSINTAASVGRARSRMAGNFLASQADVWLTVDDDNWVDADTLRRLVDAARATRGAVAVPYWLRQTGARLSFHVGVEPAITPEGLLTDAQLLFGFGVVALHRDAVSLTARAAPTFSDESGGPFPALFLEDVRDGLWIGEDFMFCHRARDAGVPLHLLLDAFCESPK